MRDPDANISELLINLTSDIVSSYVGNNEVGPDEVTNLIGSVHSAIVDAAGAQQRPVHPISAVPIEKSIEQDHIFCLECGRKFRTLKRHITSVHAMTEKEYRNRWSLPDTYPMIAPSYLELRKKLVSADGPRRNSPTRRGAGGKRAS